MAARQIINLTGQRFGKLVVVAEAERLQADKYVRMWRCLCDCGQEIVTRSGDLRSRKSSSCGCSRVGRRIHGLVHERIYTIWQGMKQRCHYQSHRDYHNYGGRGITVCDRWRNSVAAFFEDMGHPPDGYTIERKDVNGNYTPENCCWIPAEDQWKNRRDFEFYSFKGESRTLKEWSEKFGVDYSTLWNRTNQFGREAAFVLSEYFRERPIRLVQREGGEMGIRV